jgi:hypothetical protein
LPDSHAMAARDFIVPPSGLCCSVFLTKITRELAIRTLEKKAFRIRSKPEQL